MTLGVLYSRIFMHIMEIWSRRHKIYPPVHPGRLYLKMIRRFQSFTGYLSIICHDMKAVLPVLAEACGVYIGLPFSNRVIDTKTMAMNHLSDVRDYSLEALSDELGIDSLPAQGMESRCRKTWKPYLPHQASLSDYNSHGT